MRIPPFKPGVRAGATHYSRVRAATHSRVPDGCVAGAGQPLIRGYGAGASRVQGSRSFVGAGQPPGSVVAAGSNRGTSLSLLGSMTMLRGTLLLICRGGGR